MTAAFGKNYQLSDVTVNVHSSEALFGTTHQPAEEVNMNVQSSEEEFLHGGTSSTMSKVTTEEGIVNEVVLKQHGSLLQLRAQGRFEQHGSLPSLEIGKTGFEDDELE